MVALRTAHVEDFRVAAVETGKTHVARGVRDMRDFNTVKADLIRHLNLSCQKTDGEILWYEGTLELLVEFLTLIQAI